MGKKISRLIGLILIVVIFSQLDWSSLKQALFQANLTYLIIGLAMTLTSAFASSYRWNYLKKIQGLNYSNTQSFIIYCASHLAGSLTPGRVGEFSKIFYLKNDGHSYGRSAFSVILDRLFDVIFLLLFALFGMLLFLNLFQSATAYLAAGLATLIILIIIYTKAPAIRKLTANLFGRLFDKLIAEKYKSFLKINYQEFLTEVKKMKLTHYLAVFLLTALAWLAFFCQMYVLALSVNINIPFLYLATSVTFAGIVTMLPISYLGLGTRDAILIGLFSVYGITKETAIIFSSLILLTYAVMAIAGFIAWQIKPFKIPTEK